MANDTVYTLVPSLNGGRYACNDPTGPELTSGDLIAVLLGGVWIEGQIEHSRRAGDGCYVTRDYTILQSGYYFLVADGTICGLCTGMKVKLL